MIKRSYQSGMMLLEALIGILIFSIGILALVAMQAAAVGAVADAQYRVEAVNLANQMLAQVWTTVDRTSDAKLATSLLAYEHQATGNPATCNFAGGQSAVPAVVSWVNMIQTGTSDASGSKPLLPGGNNAAYQQIQIDTGTNNRVTITVCWLPPNAAAGTPPNRHTVVAYVN
jgi:type IV pilus assembly protein PilV